MLTETLRSVVEIDRRTDEALIEALLAATYRASERESSAVLLRGVRTETADRMLDPVVSRQGPGAAGLRYLDEQEEDHYVEAASRAKIIVASTPGLRDRLTSRGLSPLGPREGLRALRTTVAGATDRPGASERVAAAGG